jgi:YVTN family beta-propeller protein
MEALAYTQSCTSYEEEVGIEIHLPEGIWNWRTLPSSPWLNLLACAVFVAILSSAELALSNPDTHSPNDKLLNSPNPSKAKSEQSQGSPKSAELQPSPEGVKTQQNASPVQQQPVTPPSPSPEGTKAQPNASPVQQQPVTLPSPSPEGTKAQPNASPVQQQPVTPPSPSPEGVKTQQNASPVQQQPVTPPSPSPEARESPGSGESVGQEPDFFYDGVNAAMAAAQLAQTAKTQAEWDNVERYWQQAIAAMRSVPPTNRDYTLAQQKIPEYQSYLNYAQQQPPRPTPTAVKPKPQASPRRSQPASPPRPSPEARESSGNNESVGQEPDFFYDGVNAAMAAAQLAQKAKTQAEWDAVARVWQQAIAAMQSVPPTNRDYTLAQQKLQEYQSNLNYARQMPNAFGQGVDAATQAVRLGQQAKTQTQWQAVTEKWQQAIAAMQSVDSNSPQFAIAQQKVKEYQYYLNYVRAKTSAIAARAQAASAGRMTLKHAIRSNKLSPKSVVYSGRGRFFVQNMMYNHTITVYNQQYELLKTISDAVKLSDYGHKELPGTYRGAPVEAAFSHGGRYGWVSNYQMYGSGFGNPGSDRCSPSAKHDPSFLYRINTDTLEIEKAIEVGSVPKFVAATPNNRLVLASNWCSWDLSVVDTQQNKEIRRIPLGAYPRGIAIRPDSSKAYVAVMGSSDIAVVNLQDFSVGWMRNVGAGPRHLNLSPDGRYLYASLNNEGNIAKIDLNAGNWTTVRTGSAPRSMVLSADGKFLYVVNYHSNTVSKVRTSDLRVLQNLPTDSHPIGITYDPDTQQVWVVCYSGSILIFQD